MGEKSQSHIVDLVERCLEDDQQAWQELIGLVTPVILSSCRSMRLSQQESFDVYGQVCYILLKSLSSLRSPKRLFGWIATITRREALAHDKRMRQYVGTEPETMESVLENPEGSPEDVLLESEQSQVLLAALSELSGREYRLIKALFLDKTEPSYDEISRRFNIPIASIGPTRGRALSKLQRILKRRGYKF